MRMCDSCKKSQATYHLTEIVDKEKREVHLCENCAQEKGFSLKMHFSPADLLSALIGEGHGKEEHELADLTCPECGLTYGEFRSNGRLGCPEDYNVFARGLNPLLEKIHGATQHIGKTPARAGKAAVRQGELMELRRELRRAIDNEEYETAAKLRDSIRAMEEKANES